MTARTRKRRTVARVLHRARDPAHDAKANVRMHWRRIANVMRKIQAQRRTAAHKGQA